MGKMWAWIFLWR